MRHAELMDALRALSYIVELKDDERHIRLRYMGMGEQPPEARALIDELRTLKAEALSLLLAQRPLPYLDADGSVVIPFDGHPRYFYWQAGGQPLAATEREVRGWLHRSASRMRSIDWLMYSAWRAERRDYEGGTPPSVSELKQGYGYFETTD